MLVLSRKVGESVVVGKDRGLRVTVTEVKGGKVKLAFEADRSVPVFREELLKREGGESCRK